MTNNHLTMIFPHKKDKLVRFLHSQPYWRIKRPRLYINLRSCLLLPVTWNGKPFSAFNQLCILQIKNGVNEDDAPQFQ